MNIHELFQPHASPLPTFSNTRYELPQLSYEAPIKTAIRLTDSLDPQPKLRQLREEPVKPVTEIQEGRNVHQYFQARKGHSFAAFTLGLSVSVVAILALIVIAGGGIEAFWTGLDKVWSLFV